MVNNYKVINVEYDKPIEKAVTITINRPESLNALNTQVVRDLELAISDIEIRGKELRALVITGGGDRAFMAGADIAQMVNHSPAEARNFLFSANQVLNRIEALPIPVIAKINGHALGGGLELALACDIRIGVHGAYLGLPEVSLGLIPAAGGTQRLPRIVGQSVARYMILTGVRLTAEDARKYGILIKAVEKEKLDEETLNLLKMITNNGPLALRAAKKSIEYSLNEPLRAGLEVELNNAVECFQSEDLREGMKAFLEKRPANFKAK